MRKAKQMRNEQKRVKEKQFRIITMKLMIFFYKECKTDEAFVFYLFLFELQNMMGIFQNYTEQRDRY